MRSDATVTVKRYRVVPYKGPIRLFKLVDDALARVVTRYVRSDATVTVKSTERDSGANSSV